MSVEPSSTTSTGETLHGQATQTMHGHVNSIKSLLGLDKANSPASKLLAHSKRKMAELEAARAAGIKAAPGSPDWQAAMKPESFGKGFIKANRTQFLITAGVFSLGLFWLIVIRTVHHTDNVSQTGNSEQVQTRLANQMMLQQNQQNQMQSSMPAPAGITTGFGFPGIAASAPAVVNATQTAALGNQNNNSVQPVSGFGAPSGGNTSIIGGYQATQQSASQYPQPIQMAPTTPQTYSPYAQTQPAPAYGMHVAPSSYSAPQSPGLIPARPHTAIRHQVVVNR